MLAYILGITNPGRFWGIQIGTRKIANMGSLRDFKSGQKVYKLGTTMSNRSKEISNRGRDHPWGKERLQTGTGISNRGRDYKLL